MNLYRSPTHPCCSPESTGTSVERFLLSMEVADTLLARFFKWIRFSTALVLTDFLLNIIWLTVDAHQTYGIRTAREAFMTTYNGTGAPAG